jgi:hypothetical protein
VHHSSGIEGDFFFKVASQLAIPFHWFDEPGGGLGGVRLRFAEMERLAGPHFVNRPQVDHTPREALTHPSRLAITIC